MKESKELLLKEKAKYDLPLTVSQRELKLLAQNKPIQHIIGFIDYTDVKIKVNQNVLIPRYETEELIYLASEIIRSIPHIKQPKILDLCTGSGFIGFSLKKKFPQAQVVMTDISKKALKIARYNARKNFGKSFRQIKILHRNLFHRIKGNFDLIIANPPYLDKNDVTVEESVRNNEPLIALFAAKKGWDIYEKILANSKKYFSNNPYAKLLMEINPLHSNKWQQIIDCKIIKDINGKNRFVKLDKNY
ncbi:peptide chain release factor N(5)-glutamine methyltransferase [Mycoplasmopsis columbinasalis]|uniref:peptide chain release factor N(5)-glutamine methyltransferase n=1 Tax=Mycoplasmopsis columbinasalis TaxID=114880 RepID=UPI0022854D83